MAQPLLSAFLLALAGCASAPEPASTAPLALPVVPDAVAVSSARFLGPTPDRSLSNSELRNCRFGRTDKIDLVPVVLEWTDTALRFLGDSVMPLQDGALPQDLSALRARMEAVSASSRSLAEGGCHPWRGTPGDLSMVPALLIAADAHHSGQDLARLSKLAAEAGLPHQAVWVAAEQTQPAQEVATPTPEVTPLQTGDGTLSATILAAVKLRSQGLPCVQLSTQHRAQPLPEGDAAPPEPHMMRGSLSVVPLFWPTAGGNRMVSGDRCMAPSAPQTIAVPGEPPAP